MHNAVVMANHMELKGRGSTDLQSFLRAFEDLRAAGKLTLVKPESVDQYFQNHPELPRTSYRQEFSPSRPTHGRQKVTFAKHGKQQRRREQELGVSRTIHEIIKPACHLRNLLRTLSAEEFAERCKDPEFRFVGPCPRAVGEIAAGYRRVAGFLTKR